jgi:hypothetical protein
VASVLFIKTKNKETTNTLLAKLSNKDPHCRLENQ